MKRLSLLAIAAALLTGQAHAAEADLSVDTKRMLAYGTLAVMTGACKTSLTPPQTAQMNTGLEQASVAQKDLTQAEFTDMMKAVGMQVGQNKAEICASLTPEYVNTSLKEAAAGE